MSLHSLERTLLSLYSNANQLNSFVADPQTFTASLDLSPAEKAALRGIPHDKLRAFQAQLHNKSQRAAERMLRKHGTLVLLSLHPQSPVILWGTPERHTYMPVSPGSYTILHRLARLKIPFTLREIFSHYIDAPESTLSDVSVLVRLLFRHRLHGAVVRIPLVL